MSGQFIAAGTIVIGTVAQLVHRAAGNGCHIKIYHPNGGKRVTLGTQGVTDQAGWVLLGYMEKLRRDLAANTAKTETISHSVNGSLDARLAAMAEDIKRNFGEALAEANQDMERRLDSLDKRLEELERKANL